MNTTYVDTRALEESLIDAILDEQVENVMPAGISIMEHETPAGRLVKLKDLVIVHRVQAAESKHYAHVSILLYVALQRAITKNQQKES